MMWFMSQREIEISPMEVYRVLVAGHQHSQKALLIEAW